MSLLSLEEEWAERQLAAFLLWTSSLGVFARGSASADYRLQDHQDIRLLLQDLLESLQTNLELLQGDTNAPPKGTTEINVPVSASKGPESELAKNVEVTLSYLTELAISIRKSGTRYRDSRAEQFGKNDSNFQKTRAETYDFLTSIRLSGIFKECQSTTESLAREVNFKTPVIERLVDCNMKRWNRFLYARHHDKTLSAVPSAENAPNLETRIDTGTDRTSGQILPEISQTISEGVVGTPTSMGPEATVISKLSTAATPIGKEALEVTLAPVIEDPSEAPAPNVAGSFVAGRLRLKYPKPPKTDASSKYFQCSCCRQLLPIEFAERENWRKHVKADLKPYVCLMDSCSQPLETFADTKDWLSHMDAEHRKTIVRWTCNAKHESPAVFSSEEAFVGHMKNVHPKVATRSQLPIITKRSGKPAAQMFVNCPLCGWVPDTNQTQVAEVQELSEKDIKGILDATQIRVKTKLNKHIAEHLQDIALRSLPEEIFRSEDESIRSVSSSTSSTVSMSSDLEITTSEVDFICATPLDKPKEEDLGETISDDVQGHWSQELTTTDSRTESWGWLFSALTKIHIARPDLPNPFMCPHLENPQFIDRPKLFRQLLNLFRGPMQRRNPKIPIFCTLRGPGGSGKTDLAAKFVHRLRRHDRNISIFWLVLPESHSFDRAACVKKFLVEIAHICWLPSTDAQYVREWLSQEQNGPWLIVMDAGANSDPFLGDIISLFPGGSHGSLLMLLRTNSLPIQHEYVLRNSPRHESPQIAVTEMTESESWALLRSRVPCEYNDENISTLAANADTKLPLALIKAADAFLFTNSGTVEPVDDGGLVTKEATSRSQSSAWRTPSEIEGDSDADVDYENAATARNPVLQIQLEEKRAKRSVNAIAKIVPERRPNKIALDQLAEADNILRPTRSPRISSRTNRLRRAGSFETNPPASGEAASAASSFIRGFHWLPDPRREDEPPLFDAEGQEIGEGYVLGKQIGFGGHSTIKEATRMRVGGKEQKFAVKIVRKKIYGVSEKEKEKILTELENEIYLWRLVDHRHILPLESVYWSIEAVFCVMPLNVGGTLFDLISANRQGIECELAKDYSYQLALALQYLHFEAYIVHCDVTLEHCLIGSAPSGEPGLLRLCDFGLANRVDSQTVLEPYDRGDGVGAATLRGSLEYAAPELLRDQSKARLNFPPAVDVWAYGVCVYTIMTGQLPFQASFTPRIVKSILEGDWDRDRLAEKGRDEVTELINGCLEMDVAARWDMKGVQTCSWFNQYVSINTQVEEKDTTGGKGTTDEEDTDTER